MLKAFVFHLIIWGQPESEQTARISEIRSPAVMHINSSELPGPRDPFLNGDVKDALMTNMILHVLDYFLLSHRDHAS